MIYIYRCVKEEKREGGRRIGGDFFERKEKGELFWIVRGDSFWVRACIGGFLGEKNRGNGEEQLQPRLSRYASCYS